METRLEAVSSPVSLWWAKLGQWQALMVVITLIAFFVTLGLTGDKKTAFAAAIATAFVTTFAAAIAATTIAAVTTAVVATFAAFVAFAIFVATAVVTTFAAAIATTAIAAAVTTFAFTTAADKVPGVGEKAVRFSYMGEFLLILLPMLVALRG